MKELIEAYTAEIKMAERDMERWKDSPLQYNVAEQRKITYSRVIDDLQNHGVSHHVSKCPNCGASEKEAVDCIQCKTGGYPV